MAASARVREAEEAAKEAEKAQRAAEKAEQAARRDQPKAPAGSKETGNPVLDFLTSRQGQAIGKEIVRGVFGMLKKR
jgi:hypothetical protein